MRDTAKIESECYRSAWSGGAQHADDDPSLPRPARSRTQILWIIGDIGLTLIKTLIKLRNVSTCAMS
jgi:hypothetical protein